MEHFYLDFYCVLAVTSKKILCMSYRLDLYLLDIKYKYKYKYALKFSHIYRLSTTALDIDHLKTFHTGVLVLFIVL